MSECARVLFHSCARQMALDFAANAASDTHESDALLAEIPPSEMCAQRRNREPPAAENQQAAAFKLLI